MGRVLALSGGVGGAKLCAGLAEILAPGELHVAINTADDFRHLGLAISPDIDTLLYTLSGRASGTRGWGLEGETWQAMAMLEELGGETWFRLGDRDLATHLLRTSLLERGLSLTQVTGQLAGRLGIASHLYPMSDDPVRTLVQTGEGELPFQEYFVGRQCRPRVTGFRFAGLERAAANPLLLELLASGTLECILICPSNPYVSIDPILRVGDLWRALHECPAPVIAVSPIVAGAALKGPAAKMMSELGVAAGAGAVLDHYRALYPDLLDGFVIDDSDAKLAAGLTASGVDTVATATIMNSLQDKRDLARFCIRLARRTP